MPNKAACKGLSGPESSHGKHLKDQVKTFDMLALPGEIFENVLDQLTIRDIRALAASNHNIRALTNHRLDQIISLSWPSNKREPKGIGGLSLPKSLLSAAKDIRSLYIKTRRRSHDNMRKWTITPVMIALPNLYHMSIELGVYNVTFPPPLPRLTHLTYTFQPWFDRIPEELHFSFQITLFSPKFKHLELISPNGLLTKLVEKNRVLAPSTLPIKTLSVISPHGYAMEGVGGLLDVIVGLQEILLVFGYHNSLPDGDGGLTNAYHIVNPRRMIHSLLSQKDSLKEMKFIEALDNPEPMTKNAYPQLWYSTWFPVLKNIVIPSTWFIYNDNLMQTRDRFPSLRTIQVQFVFATNHWSPTRIVTRIGQLRAASARLRKAKENKVLPCLEEVIWWFHVEDHKARAMRWTSTNLNGIRKQLGEENIKFRWIWGQHLNDTPMGTPFVEGIGRYYGECSTAENSR